MARIVLVHGAFGGSWAWADVIEGLRTAGHAPEAVDLPGNRLNPMPVGDVTLDVYADHVGSVLSSGPPAILVGHSMGGVVVTQAAARGPEHVRSLVYVAAFVPSDGQSLLDLVALPEAAGDQVQANLVVEGDPPYAVMPAAGARVAVYNCATEEQARDAAAHLSPQPLAPFGQAVRVPAENADAFAALPRAYVTCLQDRAIQPALQRRMFSTAGCDPVIELDTDHSPWLTATDELVAALDGIASGVTAGV